MSELGYIGRALRVVKDGQVIAAVQNKTGTLVRTPIDVTNDDSDSFQRFLPVPGRRGVDISVSGVATVDNFQVFLSNWNGNVLQDVELHNPDGSIIVADDGFFLGNLEFTGAFDGAVTFSATLQSSGPVQVVQS